MNKINFSYKFNSKKDDIIYLLLEGSILLFIKSVFFILNKDINYIDYAKNAYS